MDVLIKGITSTTWQMLVMWAIGALLIYLAIAKDFEPSLLLPMGFGAILVNIPFTGVLGEHGPLSVLLILESPTVSSFLTNFYWHRSHD